MDDLIYDDLENFNEGNRIAELQSENTDLKSRLEEYALTLDKLQKDFDKLSSEHKILEVNYSSLLKTAKAEIERKTQIIKTLNFEKDKMVLESYQNKNMVSLHGSRPYEKQMSLQKRDTKCVKKTEINRKPSPHTRIERKEKDQLSSNDNSTKTNTEINNEILNISNKNTRYLDPRTGRSSDVKEKIIQPMKENDTYKPRASIQNRRKSMPAVSLGIEKFSSDDEDMAHAVSPKDLSRENSNKRHLDRNFSEKESSRRSETSSLEEKTSGYHDQVPNPHRSRYSRYDDDQIKRHRKRDKSSHRYKIPSPDRYRRRPDYQNDPFHRSQNDRHRVVESPPRDRYYLRQSRDPQRNTYERSHLYEHDKLQHKSQEKYTTKHKIQHSHNESNSKRTKIERKDVEPRLQDEREHLEKKYEEPFKFTSCESPDYNHPDVYSTHQIREIKLTATTKIDDPRLSNKKYVIKNNDGIVELSTAEGRNVDIVPVNKTAWGIIPINMPEALVRRPSEETEKIVKVTGFDNDNTVVNTSIESGEILDQEDLVFHTGPNDTIKENKVSKNGGNLIPVINALQLENIDNSLQKVNSYKIPKLKINVDNKPSRKKTKNTTESLKPERESTTKNKNSESTNKSRSTMDSEIKKSHLETEKGDIIMHDDKNLPYLDINDKLKYTLAKAVVEGDLELSDDTCDYNERPDHVAKEHKKRPHQNEKDEDKSCSRDTVNQNSEEPKTYTNNVKGDKIDVSVESKVVVRTNIDKSPEENKKSKHKKKPKNKETKEVFENKDTTEISKKTTRRKGKETETKTKQMKTKFNELFDDSSSLISPEDLGLTALPTHITPLPDKCVPFFEDAQDVDDINKGKTTRDLARVERLHEDEKKQSDNTSNTTIIDTATTDNQQSTVPSAPNNVEQPEINVDLIENIYKNLEPENQEKDVVKTVIISTGVQPQIAIESENHELTHKLGAQIRTTNQDSALKALATSTPHKTNLQLNFVQTDAESKLPDTVYNSKDSQVETGVQITALDNSVNITLDSQTNDTQPDVRIFVKRRRKIIKK